MVRAVPVAALLLAITLSACSRNAPEGETAAGSQPEASTDAAPEALKPVPAQLPDVLARVNGEDISKTDFERAIRSVEGNAGGPVPATERDRVYRGVLDELIGYRLLLQASRDRKVAVADAEIDARVQAAQSQFGSADAFKKVLAEQDLTLDQVRTEMRNEMTVTKLLETEVTPKTAVTPEQVTAFYKENPTQFTVPEQVRASHVLISVPEGADAPAKAAALAKATAVLKDAKAGKDFAALARQHSQDPGSAPGGGDLGYFSQGQMVGPFNDVAFSLAPGAISDVVETQFGYHIIKVIEKQPGRQVALEEARPRIEQFLQSENRRKATEAFVQDLRMKGKVDVFI